MPIDWAQLFAGNSLPVVTRAALIVLLACLFFVHASMSVHGDFCAVVFHVPAHAHGHDDNASCNVCWLLSVAVFRVFSASPFPACWLLSVSHHPRVPCTTSRSARPETNRSTSVHDTPYVCVTGVCLLCGCRSGAVVHCFLINHVCQICAPSAAQPARTATRARLVRRTRETGE